MAFTPTSVGINLTREATFIRRFGQRVTALGGTFEKHPSKRRGRRVRLPLDRNPRAVWQLVRDMMVDLIDHKTRLELIGLSSDFTQWALSSSYFDLPLFYGSARSARILALASSNYEFRWKTSSEEPNVRLPIPMSEQRTMIAEFLDRIAQAHALWEREELPKIQMANDARERAAAAIRNIRDEAYDNLVHVLAHAGCSPEDCTRAVIDRDQKIIRIQIADLEMELRIVAGSEKRVVEKAVAS